MTLFVKDTLHVMFTTSQLLQNIILLNYITFTRAIEYTDRISAYFIMYKKKEDCLEFIIKSELRKDNFKSIPIQLIRTCIRICNSYN